MQRKNGNVQKTFLENCNDWRSGNSSGRRRRRAAVKATPAIEPAIFAPARVKAHQSVATTIMIGFQPGWHARASSREKLEQLRGGTSAGKVRGGYRGEKNSSI